MKTWAAPLALILLCACAPKEADAPLRRRAVGPAPRSGWVKLPLDGPAQRERSTLWLGDGEGRAVPFLWAGDAHWNTRPLTLSHVLLGKDPEGRPSAEFSLKPAEHEGGAGPERITLTFQFKSAPPWACQAQVARRQEAGPYLALDLDPAPVLYDFGASGSRTTLSLPWDGQGYRVTLTATAGAAPTLQGVSAQAVTRLVEEQDNTLLEPSRESLPAPAGQKWRLKLPAEERVVGVQIVLEPPAAPLLPILSSNGAAVSAQGLLWNLPALGSVSSRLAVGPVFTSVLDLALPEGARLQSAKVLVRNEVMLFPAEAGRVYWLHAGGRTKAAPGTLAILPGTGRELYNQAPLALGAPESDPQGLPALVSADRRARPWLPWAAGIVVLLLGWVAFRLFAGERQA